MFVSLLQAAVSRERAKAEVEARDDYTSMKNVCAITASHFHIPSAGGGGAEGGVPGAGEGGGGGPQDAVRARAPQPRALPRHLPGASPSLCQGLQACMAMKLPPRTVHVVCAPQDGLGITG